MIDEKKLAKEIVRQTKEAKIPKMYKNPKSAKLMSDLLWMAFYSVIIVTVVIIVNYEIEEVVFEQTIDELTNKNIRLQTGYDDAWEYVYESSDLHKETISLLDCATLKTLLMDDEYRKNYDKTIRDLILSRSC